MRVCVCVFVSTCLSMCLQGCMHACYASLLYITCNEIMAAIFMAAQRLAEGVLHKLLFSWPWDAPSPFVRCFCSQYSAQIWEEGIQTEGCFVQMSKQDLFCFLEKVSVCLFTIVSTKICSTNLSIFLPTNFTTSVWLTVTHNLIFVKWTLHKQGICRNLDLFHTF